MKIIPVLDLKNGVVVHARLGDREHYQPIQSKLCPSSDIFAVIEAFLSIYDFDTFYIADLNAITQQGSHDRLIQQLLADYPNISFWIDKGYQPYCPELSQWRHYLPVLGSESYQDETVCELDAFRGQFVLSLDYSISGALGAQSLFFEPHFWPDNIIVMNLAGVGSNQGPDVAQLSQFCTQYPEKNFIAAGGIRHLDDLMQLRQIGVQQALIASSLHSGALKRKDIEEISGKKIPRQAGVFLTSVS
ncbi:MAG: HisA/HisF-related TIM barrel protein [Methylovulum sp.]|nr:HisA/HisF-related TIM barrel protein [Methylovulum sp.]